MATVSRFNAICSVGKNVRFSGFVAWLTWLVVHLMYLVGFDNRLTTIIHWTLSFVFRGRSQRTTTLQQTVARTLIARLDPDQKSW